MKKKIFLFLLAAIILLTCTASAGNSINLYVNGKEVYASAPPVIVNDRVMVPIRFVAEALDCSVTWNDSTNSVFISEKKNTVTPPAIEGTAEFKEVIEGVLSLAKQKDPELYNWYISNADVIKLGDANDHIANNFMDGRSREAVITIDEEYFNIAMAKYSTQDSIMFYAGILAHECEHTPNYFNYIYSESDVEAMCWLASVRAFKKLGGNNSEFEKFFKDSVYDQLKL